MDDIIKNSTEEKVFNLANIDLLNFFLVINGTDIFLETPSACYSVYLKDDSLTFTNKESEEKNELSLIISEKQNKEIIKIIGEYGE